MVGFVGTRLQTTIVRFKVLGFGVYGVLGLGFKFFGFLRLGVYGLRFLGCFRV